MSGSVPFLLVFGLSLVLFLPSAARTCSAADVSLALLFLGGIALLATSLIGPPTPWYEVVTDVLGFFPGVGCPPATPRPAAANLLSMSCATLSKMVSSVASPMPVPVEAIAVFLLLSAASSSCSRRTWARRAVTSLSLIAFMCAGSADAGGRIEVAEVHLL